MDTLNRAHRRQNARGLLVSPNAAADRAAEMADQQQRRALRAQTRRDRSGHVLQCGSLAIAFLAQVSEHRSAGAVPDKAIALLERLFDQGAEILTEPDEDDEDEEEEDEDEDERAN